MTRAGAFRLARLWLGLAVVYLVAAKLGLALASAVQQVSLVWPPAGLALGAVVVFGTRCWPGVFLGALAANATASEPIGTALGIACGNTLEALAGAWLLQRWAGARPTLGSVRQVLALLLAGAVAATVAATVGTASLCLGGVQPWAMAGSLWSTWWIGDAMGVLLVAPALLAGAERPPTRAPLRPFEAGALVVGLILVGQLVFSGWFRGPFAGHELAYLLFPFPVWAALRFGQRATALALLLTAAIAVANTAMGTGPFRTDSMHQSLGMLQLFLVVLASSSLLLGAVAAKRREAEARAQIEAAIARAVADADSAEAAGAVLAAMSGPLRWQHGAIWTVDEEAEVLRCMDVWHAPGRAAAAFHDASCAFAFRRGEGLPGRVWASGEAAWIEDVTRDPNFPRASMAAEAGLRAACGFPLRCEGRIIGVVEFFTTTEAAPDPGLLETMTVACAQVGQLLERRRVRAKLVAGDAVKAAMLETSLDAVIGMDHGGRITEFNPAAERIFGWARSEAVGRSLADLLVPPALRELHRSGLVRYLATGASTILGRRVEMTAVRRDGTEFPVELAVVRIAGEPARFAGHLRDITERRRWEERLQESESRFRNVADTAPVMIWRSGTEKRRTWFNRPWLEFTGRSAEEEAGEGWTRGVHPEDLDRCLAICGTAFDVRRPFRLEYRLRRSDGAWRWVLDQGVPVHTPVGALAGYIGSCIDITDRREDEQALARQAAELARTNRDLARSNAELARFAQVASHDLQEPARTLVTVTQLLDRSYGQQLGPDGADIMKFIVDSATRMQDLVRDLLVYSRTGARAEPEAVSTERVMGQVLLDLRAAIEERGAIVRTGSLPVVRAGERDLLQLFQNLVANAVKFGRERGPEVEVRAGRREREWLFSVRDNGIGIEPEYLDKVFVLFQRLRPAEYPGTGVGLAICKRVVETYGGRIWVESRVGEGSTFYFTLPA